MKFRVVEELATEQRDVALSCDVFKISRGGYYSWLKRPLSVRKTEDEVLWQKIKSIWEKSRKTYGSPRILDKLQKQDVSIGKHRVARLMKENNIQGAGKKKFKISTTDSNHKLPIAERVFKTEVASEQVTKVNQFWGGDITYIPTEQGWLYLAIFLDLFTRKVVGHAMNEEMPTSLVLEALEMGLAREEIELGMDLTTHTDRGCQYAAEAYRNRLEDHQITQSMSRKGNCYDNAFVESFFRTLKVELIYRRSFKTREEAQSAIFEFIEVWYNRQRSHSSLDYMTPFEYEQLSTRAA